MRHGRIQAVGSVAVRDVETAFAGRRTLVAIIAPPGPRAHLFVARIASSDPDLEHPVTFRDDRSRSALLTPREYPAERMVERGTARHIDGSAVAAFVPVLALAPFSLIALAVFWIPARWLFGIDYWVFVGVFAVAGVLLFVRPVQVFVLTPLLGARSPSPAERDVLDAAWADVAFRTGLSPRNFVLRVLPTEEVNAFACGGHLVVVTSFAVERLPPGELRGVVAHEVAHHLGLHTVAYTLGHWVTAPMILLARIGFFLQNVARAAAASFGKQSAAVAIVGTMVAGVISAVSWVFTAALRGGDALANLVGHRAEYDADRRVAKMGYGRELAAALRRTIAAGHVRSPRGWRARLAASHPPARLRVARIEAFARHPSR
jgi:Zn-dependent protease with chaperone function